MGVIQTDTILDKIIEQKWREIAIAEASISFAQIRQQSETAPAPRDFLAALRRDHIALIAEVKHASPSKGVLIDPFHPVEIARYYAEHGAAAISVLTDEQFFRGHLDYLRQIRAAVGLPLLRKEFIVAPYQVYEARAAGADAILLIVAVLEDELLSDLHTLATELGMAALVEVHDESELERALKFDPPLVGVNNRDLRDFTVDLGTTARLANLLPSQTILVGESGIKSRQDVAARVDAILVGETIITAPDRAQAMQELTSIKR